MSLVFFLDSCDFCLSLPRKMPCLHVLDGFGNCLHICKVCLVKELQRDN